MISLRQWKDCCYEKNSKFNVERKLKQRQCKATAQHIAAHNNCNALRSRLLDSNAETDLENGKCDTPLIVAKMHSQLRSVNRLFFTCS